jgi:hypothetical protein
VEKIERLGKMLHCLPLTKVDGGLLGHIRRLAGFRTIGTKGEIRRFGTFRTVDTHKFDIWVGEDMELRTNITWLTTGEELHHHHNLMASVRDQCHKQYSEGYLVCIGWKLYCICPMIRLIYIAAS